MDEDIWELLKDVRFVFWVCQDHETEHVTWRTENGKKIPRCEHCGKEGDPQ